MKRTFLRLLVGVAGSAVLAQTALAAGAPDAGPARQTAASRLSLEDWYAKNASKIANRNALVGAVMQNLQFDIERLGVSIQEKARLQTLLHSMPTESLERATALTTIDSVEAFAIQSIADSRDPARSATRTKSLGDQGQDLIFNPYGPCRIVDTRGAAAGAITGGTARPFKNFNSTAQGTGTGNCNLLPGGPGTGLIAGTGGAIAITVTGVPPGATGSLYGNTGFLTARPVGDTNLTATVLIQAGTPFTAANSTVIRTSTGANDFEIYAAITSHVVVDLLGFYVPPAQTALDCQAVYDTTVVSVPAGGTTCSNPPACPAGYTAVAPLFDNSGFGALAVSQMNLDQGGLNICGYNSGGAPSSYFPGVRCCRTPGSTAGRF